MSMGNTKHRYSFFKKPLKKCADSISFNRIIENAFRTRVELRCWIKICKSMNRLMLDSGAVKKPEETKKEEQS